MDPERTQRLFWALAALGFGMAILGAVGELLGWWNDVGQILMVSGSLLGVLMSTSSLLLGSSSEQVDAVLSGQGRTHETLDSMDGKLDSMDGKLDSVDGKLDSMDGKLGSVDGKLGSMDGNLASVDSKLDRQTDVLEDIRDAL